MRIKNQSFFFFVRSFTISKIFQKKILKKIFLWVLGKISVPHLGFRWWGWGGVCRGWAESCGLLHGWWWWGSVVGRSGSTCGTLGCFATFAVGLAPSSAPSCWQRGACCRVRLCCRRRKPLRRNALRCCLALWSLAHPLHAPHPRPLLVACVSRWRRRRAGRGCVRIMRCNEGVAKLMHINVRTLAWLARGFL